MSYVGAIGLVLGFVAVAHGLGMVRRAKRVFARSRQAMGDMFDPQLSEEEKEKRLRSHAVGLLGLFAALVGISVLALGAPVLVLVGADRLGWLSLEDSIALTLEWPFLVGVTVVMLGLWWLAGKVSARKAGSVVEDEGEDEFENRYSSMDRLLHQVVFGSVGAQVAFSGLEDRVFRKKLATIDAARPLFITGLPRSGTTMLLNLLDEAPEFATHRYRDMPFVICPMFWSRLASRFRREDHPRERAHGDGVMVSLDSPEAFEEMIWRHFWPRHYTPDRVLPWAHCNDQAFLTFFRNHMRKIIGVRSDGAAEAPTRYLSKNNGNIARASAITEAMGDATVVVPFREPIQHAMSLWRQHTRFTEVHRQDTFARDFMAGIGHYDFGANLRPIDFNGWTQSATPQSPGDPLGLSFWLRYWIATYEDMLGRVSDRLMLVSYDDVCREPAAQLRRLGEAVGVKDVEALCGQASKLRDAPRREVDTSSLDQGELTRARELYRALIERSIMKM
jgi:hypothetical protein